MLSKNFHIPPSKIRVNLPQLCCLFPLSSTSQLKSIMKENTKWKGFVYSKFFSFFKSSFVTKTKKVVVTTNRRGVDSGSFLAVFWPISVKTYFWNKMNFLIARFHDRSSEFIFLSGKFLQQQFFETKLFLRSNPELHATKATTSKIQSRLEVDSSTAENKQNANGKY